MARNERKLTSALIARVSLSFALLTVPLLAFPTSDVGPHPRSVAATRGKAPSIDRVERSTVSRGASGKIASDPPKPFSIERARGIVARVEKLLVPSSSLPDPTSSAVIEARRALDDFAPFLGRREAGVFDVDGDQALKSKLTEIENLEGVLSNGRHEARMLRFRGEGETRGAIPPVDPMSLPGFTPEAVAKINTGWILDRHIYDSRAAGYYPTLPSNIKNYDESTQAIAMGEIDEVNSGWVWQVHSFYWTDTTLADHVVPSYCLAVMISGDGGSNWELYGILYDPSATASRDLVNPKLVIDYKTNPDRIFIAYELVLSASNHDVYVYSETSVLGGFPANPQTAALATSVLMERRPDIATDFKPGIETAYRVVVYEKEYVVGEADYDIYGRQASGVGTQAEWSATTAVAIADLSAAETAPAIASGTSGSSTFSSFMHLAYNYDTYTSNQLLLNPGFELGNNGNWTANAAAAFSSSGLNTHGGSWKAFLGRTNDLVNDWIYQELSIPSDANTVQLAFWLKIISNDSTSTPYDYLNVEVRDSAGALLKTLDVYDNTDEAAFGSYVELLYNLTEFKGQTIRIHFWASTDSSYVTNFFIDDTALNVTTPATSTAHEVQYAQAAHPGTSYPSILASATKLTVLSNLGPTRPYGPPAIASSHGGGSAGAPGARIVVAADQFFPAGNPTAPDPARYQICFAWNTCNGDLPGTCGAVTPACTPAESLDWNEEYFLDTRSDERYPSLAVDGAGMSDSGVGLHWLIYMAYYHRPQDSLSPYGSAQMIIADASDEDCGGFASGAWYYLTASIKATDDDDLVVAKPNSIAAFNYGDIYPGVAIVKHVPHFQGLETDDVYFTTLGDNYTIDAKQAGLHVDSGFTLDGVRYLTPWVFAWAAGYQWDLVADPSVEAGDRYALFERWSDGTLLSTVSIRANYCFNPDCQVVAYDEIFGNGCLIVQPEVSNVSIAKGGPGPTISWSPSGSAGDVDSYRIFRGTDPSLAGSFPAVGNSAVTSWNDVWDSAPLYCYVVKGECGPYEGP